MKCPKCGFNSFEYYDNCKKCSSDLIGYKLTHSITPLVLPLEAKNKLAADFRPVESTPDQISDAPETHDDIFSFDLPDDSTSTPARHSDDPFNLNETSPGLNRSGNSKPDDNGFSDLLESTSQSEESPFSAPETKDTPSVAKAADSTSGAGGFDLESFSWDETPAAASETESKAFDDDFDSLFGDTKETAKQ